MSNIALTEQQPFLSRLNQWVRRKKIRARLAIALTLASAIAGIATYAAMTKAPFFGYQPGNVTTLLLIDLVLLLMLSVLITHRMVKIFVTRRRNQAGSRLHLKMVSVFTLLAITPSIIVACFAAGFFYFGVQAWFSERVKTAVNESLVVAQSYLKEHQKVLRADALAMASDINRESYRVNDDPVLFAQVVATQASMRSLTEAIVFDGKGKILARAGLSFALTLEPITDDMLERARKGEVVLAVSDDEARVRAMTRLDNFIDAYLFVGRLVEPKVLAHMATTQGAVKEYKELEARRTQIEIMITIAFIAVAVLLLMAAIWFGLNFATQLVRPIGNLIDMAERVRAGDLTARIQKTEAEIDNELGALGSAFNRMTQQLQSQRRELVEANRQLDNRRRFTEAVLGTVPAGVVGINSEGVITLANHAACELLNIPNADKAIGVPLHMAVPEMDSLLEGMGAGMRYWEGQVELVRLGQASKTLLVRIAADISRDNQTRSYVVTFDDVSDLLSAQRKAAWSDVARRIAHEIKNPLTPIQLSAERLRRRYAKQITEGEDVFIACTETIMRQVEDIGRMVDEFSSFARMPLPVMAEHDMVQICRQAVFMISTSRPDIEFLHDLPPTSVLAVCDGSQITQALTNILKNATEAIDGREQSDGVTLPKGCIKLRLDSDSQTITFTITDNGKGLPVNERNRLTEPYVTTRAKGTGLGLAIVKKIIEDHNGTLKLVDSEEGGAKVVMMIARTPATEVA